MPYNYNIEASSVFYKYITYITSYKVYNILYVYNSVFASHPSIFQPVGGPEPIPEFMGIHIN